MTKKLQRKGPEPCPQCGGLDIVPIMYGLPGPEAMEAAEQGRIALGGCCVGGRDGISHGWVLRDPFLDRDAVDPVVSKIVDICESSVPEPTMLARRVVRGSRGRGRSARSGSGAAILRRPT